MILRVLGYLLKHSNFNNPQWDEYLNRVACSGFKQAHLGGGIPDVILVKKSYPNARKKKKGRNWRLKNLAKEKEEDEVKGRRVDKARQEVDYEMFLRDLEEDVDLRGMVNMFKGIFIAIYRRS